MFDDSQGLGEVVDCVVLFLVTHRGRVPLHASAVMLGENALVLAGPSGAGKSTLALAASRAGLPVLSDDTVYIQAAPRLALWGLGRPLHVFERDAPHMEGSQRWRAGRWKKAVTIDLRETKARRGQLFLLERGARAGLVPLTAEEAIETLMTELEPGFDLFRTSLPDALRLLTGGKAWRLTLSADPAEAIDLLRRSFAAAHGAA